MSNQRKNAEGYADPTAHEAIRNVAKQEHKEFKRMQELNRLIRQMADFAGFEITNRMVFKSKQTGEEYR